MSAPHAQSTSAPPCARSRHLVHRGVRGGGGGRATRAGDEHDSQRHRRGGAAARASALATDEELTAPTRLSSARSTWCSPSCSRRAHPRAADLAARHRLPELPPRAAARHARHGRLQRRGPGGLHRMGRVRPLRGRELRHRRPGARCDRFPIDPRRHRAGRSTCARQDELLALFRGGGGHGRGRRRAAARAPGRGPLREPGRARGHAPRRRPTRTPRTSSGGFGPSGTRPGPGRRSSATGARYTPGGRDAAGRGGGARNSGEVP